MMATESSQEGSHDATVNSESEPVIKINTDFEDVKPDHPQLNGDTASAGTDDIENRQILDIVDDLVNSAEASISGGSDTEASRAKLKDDEKGHGRNLSSVKKLTSFKSLSVNKTFLAAKGSPTIGSPKSSDKTAIATGLGAAQGGTGVPAARPRLVAKSGSGLVSKSGLNGAKSATAPDPSAVWNKNRPPEPKKFTDEELKKYGIHMATRLHPDDAKGQATWADIEDDDDDWAPETITWKDGTKITIPQTEEPVVPAPASAAMLTPSESAPHPIPKDAEVVEKPKTPALLTSATPSVKPGVLVAGKGLVLKGAVEKPTLIAKPPAPPTPAKSPWAALPKIDKVSPVVMDLPPQPSAPGRFMAKEGVAPKSTTPPPPKEIAADDFSRAPWRDGPAAGNRELFNSQNGRYEPVTDRRAAPRNDLQSKHPALLHRTSTADQGPAEPSAAFQTSRMSDQHGGAYRRRASSTVSGGSGSLLRGKAHDQAFHPEVISARRESFTAVSDSPVSPTNASPSIGPAVGPRQQGQPNPTLQGSPTLSHLATNQSSQTTESNAGQGATSATGVVTDQDIANQRRLMQERREMALKRRLEEEAREEAARRERIRVKLASMGPAPESRSQRLEAAKNEPSAEPSTPSPQAAAAKPAVAPAPEAPKRIEPTTTILTKADSKSAALANGVKPTQTQAQAQLETAPAQDARSHPQGGSHAHPWPNAAGQPERYAAWSSQVPNKNVWGSPNNDRSLGNGTFNPDLVRLPDTAPIPQNPVKSGPGPIAPPKTGRGSSNAQPNTAPGNATRQPPIGPPRQLPRHETAELQPRTLLQSGWTASVRENDAVMDQEVRLRREEDLRGFETEGRTLADAQAPIKDTWRPTKLDDDGRRLTDGQRHSIQHEKPPTWGTTPEISSTSTRKPPSNVATPQPDLKANDPSVLRPGSSAPAQQLRSSRFFPSRDVRQEAPIPEDRRSTSPSPPPPDMVGHPAFDGDTARPHVSLPRPQPVVRLPPAAPATSSTPILATNAGSRFAWANTAAYKEPSATATSAPSPPVAPRGPSHGGDNKWQARIDSLLGGRKAQSPPKSLPIDSLSRDTLDHAGRAQTATVSLPIAVHNKFVSDNDNSTITKLMAEECFEEQEMGSLPPVRLPSKVPDLAWQQPSPSPKPMPKKFLVSTLSIESYEFHEESGSGSVLRIFFPGMTELKTIKISETTNRSNPRRGQRGSRHPSQGHRAGKGREIPTNHPGDQGPAPSAPASNRGGRGSSFRGRDNWQRNPSAPIST